jgi:transcriptional regulator with XRE-family HTH domain
VQFCQQILLLNEIACLPDRRIKGLAVAMNFNRDYIEVFLSIMRKYMQLRGNLSQKDLAEKSGIGISTLSRFINQKTKDFDDEVVARIVAFLGIPMHEMIDFVAEADTEQFKKLVGYVKESMSKEQEVERLRGIAVTSIDPAGKVFIEKKTPGDEFKDKIQNLPSRHKAYLSDFVELDAESREVMVDVGEAMLRYFKQNKIKF